MKCKFQSLKDIKHSKMIITDCRNLILRKIAYQDAIRFLIMINIYVIYIDVRRILRSLRTLRSYM